MIIVGQSLLYAVITSVFLVQLSCFGNTGITDEHLQGEAPSFQGSELFDESSSVSSNTTELTSMMRLNRTYSELSQTLKKRSERSERRNLYSHAMKSGLRGDSFGKAEIKQSFLRHQIPLQVTCLYKITTCLYKITFGKQSAI